MEAKGKVKAKAKKTYITKNSSGAYNVLGTIVVNKKYGLSKDYTYKNEGNPFSNKYCASYSNRPNTRINYMGNCNYYFRGI